MGIDTLTPAKWLAEVERMTSEVLDDGVSRLSLDDIGERKVCKDIIREVKKHNLPSRVKTSLDFDADTNEFVLINESWTDDADEDEDGDDPADDESLPF